MRRPVRLALGFGGLAAVAAAAVWLYPTDARRVRRATGELARLVSVPPREPELARAARIAQLARYLAPDIVIAAEDRPDEIAGRDTVTSLAVRFPPSPLGITVTLADTVVEVGTGGGTATVQTLATAREPDPRGGPDLVETRSVRLDWVRQEPGWMVARVTLGQPRSTPP
jgi:hypothetical protein